MINVFVMNDKVILKFNRYTGIEIILLMLSNMTFFIAILCISFFDNSSLDVLKANIRTFDFYFTVLGYSWFVVLLEDGFKIVANYFGFISDTHSFARIHFINDDAELNKEITFVEEKNLSRHESCFFNNCIL